MFPSPRIRVSLKESNSVRRSGEWPCWKPRAGQDLRRAAWSMACRSTSIAGEVVGLLGPNGAGKTPASAWPPARSPPTTARSSSTARTSPTCRCTSRARLGMGYLSQEPEHLPQADGREEPARDPRSTAQEPDRSAASSPVRALGAHQRRCSTRFNLSTSARTRAARCLRRREAPAGDRPLPRLRTAADSARRAVRGGRPEDHRGHPPQHPRTGRPGHRHPAHRPQRPRGAQITDRSLPDQGRPGRHAGSPQQLINDPIAINEYLARLHRQHVRRDGIPPPMAAPGPPAPNRNIRWMVEALRGESSWSGRRARTTQAGPRFGASVGRRTRKT